MPAKAKDLRKKDKSDLLKDIDGYRNELSQLRVAKVTGGTAAKLSKIRDVRKSIAVVLTVYNQTQKQNLTKQFKDAKYIPLDLRPKLTRAMRRRLTPGQAASMTLRQKKTAAHYQVRKYAVKN
eukprot:TRINITY_DN6879_c0_g1_i8.p1 TRINITY_DN6879_c0_g1~~TRINITY_DN6879_c0_g1_i8.p1  ORF type:complete len:123 (-),score=16.84 TRINITY_DN6879_c0_g1_i8:42-410(-)